MSFDLSAGVTHEPGGLPVDAASVTGHLTLPTGQVLTTEIDHIAVGQYVIDTQVEIPGLYGATFVLDSVRYEQPVLVGEGAPLVSVSDAKDFLNLLSDSKDKTVEQWVWSAQAACESYCGNRSFSAREVVETYFGDSKYLQLETPSAITVMTVEDRGSLTTDYVLSSTGDLLEKRNGTFGTCVVTYLTGVRGRDYVNAKSAVLQQLRHMWTTQRAPRGEQWDAGMGYSYPSRVKELLDPLRIGGFA